MSVDHGRSVSVQRGMSSIMTAIQGVSRKCVRAFITSSVRLDLFHRSGVARRETAPGQCLFFFFANANTHRGTLNKNNKLTINEYA